VKNKLAIAVVAVLVAFLLGFIPEYVKAEHLDSELKSAQRSSAGAELRDLAALAYVQANEKNYGLAAATASQFFNRARAFANEATVPAAKSTLDSVLAARDKVTAELAKGDPAVISDLQDLFTRTRQATLPAAAP
jgi:hypothetical protein